MYSISKTHEIKDRKVVLSLIWVFAMFNYLFTDVLTLMDPLQLAKIVSGAGTSQMTQGFLLGNAILIESAIVMIVLSRVLNYRANRRANIIMGINLTAAVFSSMFVVKPAIGIRQ